MRHNTTLHEIEVDGIRMSIIDRTGSESVPYIAKELNRDCYGLKESRFYDGDIFIDIGANVGITSIYVAKKYPNIKIVAVEPSPRNYENLLKNLEINGVRNVTTFNYAISNNNGYVFMKEVENNSGGDTVVNFETEHKIKCVPTHEFLEYINLDAHGFKYIKIDTEGSELSILSAMKEYCCDMIGLEIHRDKVDAIEVIRLANTKTKKLKYELI